MKKLLSLTAALLLAVTMLGTSFNTAEARSRRHQPYVAGAVGLGLGLIIGNEIAKSNRRNYRYSDRHCHARYCHTHAYRYSNHRHRPVVRPVRRRPVVRRGDAHENWCYRKYRSYRAYDNTFQPYNGRRRQCYSPYN